MVGTDLSVLSVVIEYGRHLLGILLVAEGEQQLRLERVRGLLGPRSHHHHFDSLGFNLLLHAVLQELGMRFETLHIERRDGSPPRLPPRYEALLIVGAALMMEAVEGYLVVLI